MNIKDIVKKVNEFRYRGKKYKVFTLCENIESFYGCYKDINGIRHCFINANLKGIERVRTLHNLITGRKVRRA
ncbi:MAG: hypothetical protein ABF652_20310 [Clostridium beijerinckii]